MIKNSFKKILCAVSAAVIIAAAQPNCLAENVMPQIRALSTVSEAGDTVKVKLWLSENTGILSLRFNVDYSDKLTLLNVFDGGILGEQHHSNQFESPYTLYWANDTESQSFTADGVLAELEFAVSDNVSDGEELFVKPVFESGNSNALDKELASVELEVFSGAVTVQKKIETLETPFLYTASGGTLSVAGVESSITELTLKSQYTSNGESYTVDKIADYAFADCSRLENITLPDSIYYIGEGAFLGCAALTYLDIPDNISYIGADAFSGCDTLKIYCYPNSITQGTLNKANVDYYVYGDLYADKQINAFDLAEMQKKLLINTAVDEKTADIKRDGKIDILDFICLKKVM